MAYSGMNRKPYRRLFSALLAVVGMLATFGCTSNAHAAPVPLGIWSWHQDAFDSSAACEQLIAFCLEHQITHISQHIGIERSGEGNWQVANATALKQLIVQAADRGITIDALRGESTMFFARHHADRLAKLKVILQFNESLPSGYSLGGVQYDVEPYLTDEWKASEESRHEVMRDYLACLDQLRKQMKVRPTSLRLLVDVPFWWDQPEHEIDFAGRTKPFVHHIQDRVDLITIMSYRRSADAVALLVEDEIAYAAESEKKRSVSIGLNFVQETGAEKVTTFAGHPRSEYHATLAELQRRFSKQSVVGRIMLHDYKACVEYLSEER